MEEEKKKTTFLFVFSTYLLVLLLKFRSWEIMHPTSTHLEYFLRTRLPQKQEIPEKTWWWCDHHVFSGISFFSGSGVCQKYAVWVLVGCRIKFCIQRIPNRHTFYGPLYPKNKKYLEKRDDDVIITFFHVFLVFGEVRSIKRMRCGYSLDEKLNYASNELSHSEFE